MSEKTTPQEKEILVVLRGILRIQRNANERVEGMFFLITGKTSYYHHAMRFYQQKDPKAPGIPALEKMEFFAFLDRVLEDAEAREDESPFLRNLRSNLEYVLTRFFTPRDIDAASNDLEGGRKNTALNLMNYLENNYGVETSVDVLFERKERELLKKYLAPPLPPLPGEEKKDPPKEASPATQAPREVAPLSCSLLIDPLHGVAANSLSKGWRLAVAFPENSGPAALGILPPPGSPGNPLPATITQVHPLEDGSYVIQLLVDGEPPVPAEASLEGNYKVRVWKDSSPSPTAVPDTEEPIPSSEKALFYIAITIALAAVLGLGYYFFS
jgi:hypothetical protein